MAAPEVIEPAVDHEGFLPMDRRIPLGATLPLTMADFLKLSGVPKEGFAKLARSLEMALIERVVARSIGGGVFLRLVSQREAGS